MHQQPRHPPRTASAANNLQTNPSRTNNSRNTTQYTTSPETMPYSDRDRDEGESLPDDGSARAPDTEPKDLTRVKQVVQQFFNKAALTIIGSRTTLPQSYNQNGDLKQNKWFNVVLDDTDVLGESLAEWKRLDLANEQPPPLCIEIYLDLQDLTSKQILAITDDSGKRWDVGEMLNTPTSPETPSHTRAGRNSQVLLERWIVEVKDRSAASPASLKDPLPNVYKKAVVLFRSLFTYTRMLPAFKYNKKLSKQSTGHSGLKLRYRISNDEFKHPRQDTLHVPLYESSDPVVDIFNFAPSNSPVGPLSISVTYRMNCDFRVDDSESLLSSHFMGLDDNYFKPSLGNHGHESTAVPGSLPVNRTNAQDRPDRSQAYGSLSTFHQVGPAAGSSPISALRAARDLPSQSPSELESSQRPSLKQGTGIERKSSLRAVEGSGTSAFQRRTSVSFQPFKAGSLSSSPVVGPPVPPSPSSSLGRGTSIGAAMQPRNRTSLTALPQTALRTPSLPNETAIASSASSSPKPAPINRYSSSFGHRRSKFSSGGGSRTEDDNLSSGKASVTSSAQPGSSMLNEGEGASSGSVQTDDENISDFLKLLEQKKDLRSFNRRDSASRDASMRRTTAALSRYQRMRDSNAALSDSMSSSLLLQRSSSSSSRQLSSVPPMIAGTSVSTSSSPGKPISPHTPHTPAIPSRLSANSIAEYDQPHRSRSRGRNTPRTQGLSSLQAEGEEADTDEPLPHGATTAIDIPTSPRPWPYGRRSSSAAHQNRTIDEEADMYGLRSASVPVDERPDLSLSELLQNHEPLASDSAAAGHDEVHPVVPALDLDADLLDSSSQPASNESGPNSQTTLPLRSRGGSSRGQTGRRGTGSGDGGSRPSRYSFSARGGHAQDDDEPLLFTMSELGAAASRRSLEEGRGGGASGGAPRDERKRGPSNRSPWQ